MNIRLGPRGPPRPTPAWEGPRPARRAGRVLEGQADLPADEGRPGHRLLLRLRRHRLRGGRRRQRAARAEGLRGRPHPHRCQRPDRCCWRSSGGQKALDRPRRRLHPGPNLLGILEAIEAIAEEGEKDDLQGPYLGVTEPDEGTEEAAAPPPGPAAAASAARRIRMKLGRTISAKNETSLRDAVAALEGATKSIKSVLSSLDLRLVRGRRREGPEQLNEGQRHRPGQGRRALCRRSPSPRSPIRRASVKTWETDINLSLRPGRTHPMDDLTTARAAAMKAARDIVAAAKTENRDLTDDEQSTVEERAERRSKEPRQADQGPGHPQRHHQALGPGPDDDEGGGGDKPAKSLGEHFVKSVGTDRFAQQLKTQSGFTVASPGVPRPPPTRRSPPAPCTPRT